MNSVLSFFRQHIVGTVCTTLVLGLLGGVPIGWSLYEARVNRIEDMKVGAIKNLDQEREDMLVLIQSFTSALINDGKLDADKRDMISASLSRQYSGYNSYSRNLSKQDLVAVQELQTALNEFRKSLMSVRVSEDLDVVYADMKNMFKAFKVVDPIMDRNIRGGESANS